MTLLHELRFGARSLLRSPALSAISVVALALGIGLTTTMFSIVYGALVRGLPFERAERLLHLERNNLSEEVESMGVPLHDFLEWREQQLSFEGLAAFYTGTVNLSGTERAERFRGGFMSANAFDLLPARPFIGRGFREGEDAPGAPPVIVLGHSVWRDRYGSDAGIVGRTIRVNGEQATVIGVMPEGFAFPIAEEVWVPLRLDPGAVERGEGTWLEVYGRLRDGVGIEAARAEMAAIARRLELEFPESNEGIGSVVKPYTEEFIGDEPAAMLLTMLAAVFGVLLLACANVANLLLSRASARTREMAVRSAVGARRSQVVRGLLAEAFALALAGGALGLGLAAAGVAAFNAAIASTHPPFWIDIGVDPVALLFALGLAVVAALLAGIVPAIQASGLDVNEVLKDESRGGTGLRIGRFRKGIVIAEIALSCALLVGAGLMVKSVVRLRTMDLPFASTDVFTARLGLFEGDYPDEASRRRFARELLTRLETQPGVSGAALASALPALGSGGTRVAIEGRTYAEDRDHPLVRRALVSPGFFHTLGVEVAQGRGFGRHDDENGAPVTIVNRSFAARHFPGESPIGRRLREGTADSEEPWRTIIGVAPDLYMDGIEDEEPEGLYVPLLQSDASFLSIVMRTPADPLSLTPLVRDEVATLDPNLPLYFVNTLERAIDEDNWHYGVFGTLFMVFGGAALFLAAIGLYGVMAFSVGRRTREIGIRMALGAAGPDIVRMVLWQGLAQLAIGLAIGTALALLLARGLELVLFEVRPWDPAIFGAAIALLGVTGLLAAFVPALRATRLHPMLALRHE